MSLPNSHDRLSTIVEATNSPLDILRTLGSSAAELCYMRPGPNPPFSGGGLAGEALPPGVAALPTGGSALPRPPQAVEDTDPTGTVINQGRAAAKKAAAQAPRKVTAAKIAGTVAARKAAKALRDKDK